MKLLEIFNQLLTEGKSVGVLYHFVNGDGFRSNVINQGFNFHQLELEYDTLPKYSKYGSALSCSRLYNLSWGSFRFNLNGDYISNTYTIMPVHYFNINDIGFDNLDSDNRTRGHRGRRQGLPVNQFEESIYSMDMHHDMPLNNKNVYSVDILVRDGMGDLGVKYANELAELVSLGIPYNFVDAFKPFKGLKGVVSMSSVKSSVNELLRFRSEDDFIKFLDGREDMKEILSDSRVIFAVCSRGYVGVLKKMVSIGVNLGLNDYSETSVIDDYSRKRTSRFDERNIVSLKAAKDNKEILSVLVTSSHIPIEVRVDMIRRYNLYNMNYIVYNSDAKIFDKVLLAALSGDLNNFKKYLPDLDYKGHLLMWIKKADKNIIKHFLSDDSVSDSDKSRFSDMLNGRITKSPEFDYDLPS